MILKEYVLMSVRLLSFELLYFVNIGLMPGPQNVPKLYLQFRRPFFAKTFFFNFNFQTFNFLKLCSIFVDSALDLFTKYNDFLVVCSVLA